MEQVLPREPRCGDYNHLSIDEKPQFSVNSFRTDLAASAFGTASRRGELVRRSDEFFGAWRPREEADSSMCAATSACRALLISRSRSILGGVARGFFPETHSLFRKALVEGIDLFETTPFLHGALLPCWVGRERSRRSHHR
ncbi:hypothetical protein CO683_28655 [Bradyrhizobium ottawaense]|nr:hypothetical protein CO683_28655 [Bradyrhizobium ottawaense]